MTTLTTAACRRLTTLFRNQDISTHSHGRNHGRKGESIISKGTNHLHFVFFRSDCFEPTWSKPLNSLAGDPNLEIWPWRIWSEVDQGNPMRENVFERVVEVLASLRPIYLLISYGKSKGGFSKESARHAPKYPTITRVIWQINAIRCAPLMRRVGENLAAN